MDTETEYKLSELSEKAKEKAREQYRSSDYPGYEWWENVYEDANEIAKILGLDIESGRTLKNGRIVKDIDISFSGFCSQGDGASFKGDYRFNPKAVDEISNFCMTGDTELIRIASELTVMQVTQRLRGYEPFAAVITQSGRYSHSNSMDFEICDWESEEIGAPDQEQFGQLMRDFADWIYEALEREHDHLMSDEVIDEQLADETFDADGGIL